MSRLREAELHVELAVAFLNLFVKDPLQLQSKYLEFAELLLIELLNADLLALLMLAHPPLLFLTLHAFERVLDVLSSLVVAGLDQT